MSNNRTNNMRDIINSVRDLQDLGDVVNGRNVYNININYYENNTHSSIIPSTNLEESNEILPEDESVILSEEEVDDVDINAMEADTQSESSTDSDIPYIVRTDLACPSDHIIIFDRTVYPDNSKCACCDNYINTLFYSCSTSTCNFIVCKNCVDYGRYYRNITGTYNPDNYLNYRHDIPLTTNYSNSEYIGVLDIPLTYSNSTTDLVGLNIIGNSISETITNAIGDIISNETVHNNMGTESITFSVGEISSLIPRGISIKELIEKTELKNYNNIINSENKCHICNEDYASMDICRVITNCSHYYHANCVDNWFVSGKNCPICNQNI